MNFLLRNIFIFAVASFYTVSCTHYGISAGNNHIKRLYDDLLVGYNRLIRPVHNNSDRLTVYIRLKLSQIIDVDEKNQVMTVNVWVRQEWIDYKLTWNPEDYGGVQRVYIPSEAIWTPDIVLYNNADGNYETTALTKAALSYDGTIVWEPPAIYKSSCLINVEYFPFDEQQCSLVFGSWTYDGNQVDLIHKCSEMLPEKYKNRPIEFGSDLRRIAQNGEWDILSVPAMRRERYYPCCRNPVPELTFNITIRRRTLFYTVNLIIPCVGICFLTVLVFYLPSDSGEKVTLCISILLSLTLFFLLLAEIIPPTSMAIPLIGKYILFTMVLVTLSICVTVIVLNFHHRSPLSHEMPEWVRIYLLNHLPKLLGMQRYTHGYIKVAPPAAAAAAHEHDDNETYYDESVRRRKRRNVFSPAIIYQHPQQLSSSSAVTEAFAASSFLSNNNINHRRTDEDALTQSPIFLSAGWQHRRQAPSSFVDNDPTYMRYNFPSHDEHYDNVRVGNMRRGKTSDEFCYINQHERAQVLSSMRKSRTVDVENKEDLNRFLPTKQLGTASGAGGDKLSRAALLPARVVDEQNNKQSLPGPVVRSMNGLFYIASHIRKQEELCNVAEEWKFVAMALDRLFLWIFSLSCVVGSLVILLNSPVLYDDKFCPVRTQGPLDVDRVYKNMTCYEIA